MDMSTAQAAASAFYTNAADTGRLGPGPPEPHACPPTLLRSLWQHFPLTILVLQLAWSAVVQWLTKWLATIPDDPGVRPGIVIPASVVTAAGFSLFVLLAFFVREATARHRDAVESLHAVLHSLRHIVRKVRLDYPLGTWHVGDHNRIFAHLAAYPIALKMTLRHERDPEQLAPLLHKDDLADVLAAPFMHLHCSKVVRAYFTSAEKDSHFNFSQIPATSTRHGAGTKFHIVTLVDSVDRSAGIATRIEKFPPALAYVTHLHAFVYIWAFMLPSSLVADSEWVTPLWAVLITYAIASLFRVSRLLSSPFDRASGAIPLSRFSARATATVLTDVATPGVSFKSIVREHPVSDWLSESLPSSARGYSTQPIPTPMTRRFTRSVALPLAAFMLWSIAVVFVTWGLSLRRDPLRDEGDRWWSVQVPLPSSATSYVSLAVFLLLSFWTTDAYARYTRALRLWTDGIRPNLEQAASIFSQIMPREFWHPRDRERIFSHLAALPVAMRLHLRDSRDLNPLREVLSSADVAAFEADPRPFPIRCMDVLLAYADSADAVDETVLPEGSIRPFLSAAFELQTSLWGADRMLWECMAIRAAPIAAPITLHLQLLTALWLILLPMAIVQTDGFVSFVYLFPIGFSTITLIRVGVRLSDPFGCEDDNLPLHTFCTEIRDSIHRIFLDTSAGTRGRIPTKEQYNRSEFQPKVARDHMDLMSSNTHNPPSHESTRRKWRSFSIAKVMKKLSRSFGRRHITPLRSQDVTSALSGKNAPTLKSTITRLVSRFPTITFRLYCAVTVWSTVSVVASWGLSQLWEGQNRGECRKWCSPIDVQGYVLSNIGFALFLILSFRTADSVQRFDDGARILYDLQRQLRGLALEFVLIFPADFFHVGYKERVVAHIVQIPLCLREMLQGGGNGSRTGPEGLLSDDDRKRFEESASPIEHLLESIETYVLLQDSRIRDGWDELGEFRAPPGSGGPLFGRITGIRELFARATTIKRFPVIASYRLHESLFTIIWLAILPLSMTQDTGFYTIIWSTLISYGVLALRDIAAQLSDPFGCEVGDLPLTQLCSNAVDYVLEGLFSAGWDTDAVVNCPLPWQTGAKGRVLGASLAGGQVVGKFALPHVDVNEADMEEAWQRRFDALSQRRTQQTLFTHVLVSTPWRELSIIFAWAVAACSISAFSRSRGGDDMDDWWAATVVITTNVVNGASFGAFTLLGLFTSAAFVRHQQAGLLWEENLRRSCHALAAAVQIFYRDGALHTGDKERLFGLIAAIPSLIKAELSGSRDLRDVSALMNSHDLAAAARGNSVVLHCFDVLQAYIIRVVNYPKKLEHVDIAIPPRGRTGFTRNPLIDIETAFQEARYLKTFGISPILKDLLKTLLTMWFLILPFVLFELSGWLTLLWVPIIAYGVVGTYQVAVELQEPFGTDLNDIDTDDLTRKIIEDVLQVQRHQSQAYEDLKSHGPPPKEWSEEFKKPADTQCRPAVQSCETWVSAGKKAIRLIIIAVPVVPFVALLAWSGLVLGIAFLLKARYNMENCTAQWFCSFVAIDADIKDYIGFALFMLLGFRITDSHARFVQAQMLWHDGVIGTVRLLSNRLLQAFAPGSFHEGDLERISGHIAAVPIVLAASLRRSSDAPVKLGQVLGEQDVNKIVRAVEPVSYCIDVLRTYLFYTERLQATTPERNGFSPEEYFNCLLLMQTLHNAAFSSLRMVRLALPFGYSSQLRIFLALYLMILPVGIVELTGWLSVMWTMLIGYGVLGILRWADELVDPFGCDESDLPVNEFVDEAVAAVKTNMRLFPRGAYTLLECGEQRPGFPDIDVVVS